MKIALTGGGTGGHFYPLVAVAQEVNRIVRDEKLITAELYYLADAPYDEKALFDNEITFVKIPAGKMRRYFSVLNIIDALKTLVGIPLTLLSVFKIFPDVIFSKGGYVSVPVIIAAILLRIPIVIHESDTVPGRANAFAAKFAKRIAVSYPEAAKYFPENKTAWTGNPIRMEVKTPVTEGADQLLQFDSSIPTVLIIGGSLGAQRLNETVVDALPKLVSKYQVIHQTGKNNFATVRDTAKLVLKNNPNMSRYRVFDYLENEPLRMAAGVSQLIVSRAGSALFEIALWKKPSIIVPITDSNGDHQRKNALAYQASGACTVIEEANLTPNILFLQIDRLLTDSSLLTSMSNAAGAFARSDAAEKIARALINISIEHEI